jgi:hypothetical protein
MNNHTPSLAELELPLARLERQKVKSIYDEFGYLGDLGVIGSALTRYAESLCPEGSFKPEGHRWVYRPKNFVAFAVHYKRRARNVTLTFSGRPGQFKESAERVGLYEAWLELENDRAGWSRYKIENAGQLLAAAYFIRLGFEYRRRRRRSQ